MNKTTKIIRIVLQVLVSAAFLGAAAAKLLRNPDELALFTAVHLDSTLIAIGILELIIPIMLWFRKTRVLAILLASAVLGAAFAETISVGMASEVIAPGLVLLFSWAIYFLER